MGLFNAQKGKYTMIIFIIICENDIPVKAFTRRATAEAFLLELSSDDSMKNHKYTIQEVDLHF